MSEDKVNHLSQHGREDDPYETIKVLRARLTPEEYVGALKFNIYKNMDRHRDKGGFEDLQMAHWYMNELMAYVSRKGYDNIYPLISLSRSDLEARAGSGAVSEEGQGQDSAESLARRLSPEPVKQPKRKHEATE